MSDELNRLQRWYSAQCRGAWEHSFGVEIGAIDNPGWQVKIDLTDTQLEMAEYQAITVKRSEADWLHCNVVAGTFHGAGGADNLTEVLSTFLDWAESRSVASP